MSSYIFGAEDALELDEKLTEVPKDADLLLRCVVVSKYSQSRIAEELLAAMWLPLRKTAGRANACSTECSPGTRDDMIFGICVILAAMKHIPNTMPPRVPGLHSALHVFALPVVSLNGIHLTVNNSSAVLDCEFIDTLTSKEGVCVLRDLGKVSIPQRLSTGECTCGCGPKIWYYSLFLWNCEKDPIQTPRG